MKRVFLGILAAFCAFFFVSCKSSETSSEIEVKDLLFSDIERVNLSPDGSLAAAEKDGKWGYIGKDGNFAIEPKFESAGDFSGALAAVSTEDEEKGAIFGYIDNSGEFYGFLRPVFHSAGPFSPEGIACVTENDSKYFYINKEGTLAFTQRVIDFGEAYYEEFLNTFNFASDFENGYALVSVYDPAALRYRFFIIESNGTVKLEIPQEYTENSLVSASCAQPCDGGFIIVGLEDGEKTLFGVLNLSGEKLIENKYEELLPYADGAFAAKQDGAWGFIDEGGNVLIDFVYEDAKGFSGGAAPVKYKGKWGLIGKDNKWIIKPQYENISENGFSENALAAEKNGKWGYVSEAGETLFPFVLGSAADFKNGCAAVSEDGTLYGFINSQFKIFIEPKFSSVGDFYPAG